jgi:hypothetical protein
MGTNHQITTPICILSEPSLSVSQMIFAMSMRFKSPFLTGEFDLG